MPIELSINWLSPSTPHTGNIYQFYFRQFEQFIGKSGAEMLAEHRRLFRRPKTGDTYPLKLFEFYKHLLTGEVRVRHMGSVKGRSGGWTGKYGDKPVSQKTARRAIDSVQSLFSFYNVPVSL